MCHSLLPCQHDMSLHQPESKLGPQHNTSNPSRVQIMELYLKGRKPAIPKQRLEQKMLSIITTYCSNTSKTNTGKGILQGVINTGLRSAVSHEMRPDQPAYFLYFHPSWRAGTKNILHLCDDWLACTFLKYNKYSFVLQKTAG